MERLPLSMRVLLNKRIAMNEEIKYIPIIQGEPVTERKVYMDTRDIYSYNRSYNDLITGETIEKSELLAPPEQMIYQILLNNKALIPLFKRWALLHLNGFRFSDVQHKVIGSGGAAVDLLEDQYSESLDRNSDEISLSDLWDLCINMCHADTNIYLDHQVIRGNYKCRVHDERLNNNIPVLGTINTGLIRSSSHSGYPMPVYVNVYQSHSGYYSSMEKKLTKCDDLNNYRSDGFTASNQMIVQLLTGSSALPILTEFLNKQRVINSKRVEAITHMKVMYCMYLGREMHRDELDLHASLVDFYVLNRVENYYERFHEYIKTGKFQDEMYKDIQIWND